ncbi:MAG: flagellar hook-length control protein FliK [Acidobacteria bacterium]|nr:flagellar hook-length control protein FliK [Acidobacteriota bacterium]
MIEQLAARIASLPTGTVTLALDPPELGHVLARLTLRGRELHVRLMAETPEVAGLLADGAARLEALLSRPGEPARVEVPLAAAGDGQRHDQAGAADRDGSRGHGQQGGGQAAQRDPHPAHAAARLQHFHASTRLDVIT